MLCVCVCMHVSRYLVLSRAILRLLVLLDRSLLLGLIGFHVIVLGVGALIVKVVLAEEAQGDADNQKQPKEVQSLERGEQGSGDVLAEAALVLLGLPVELKGPNSLKLGEQGPEDLDVDVVTEVDPGGDEDEEVGDDEGVVEVVERLGGGEEEVADVVGDVDSNAHVGEVEAVAEANESQTDNVVADELLEVLATLLHAEDENDGLLRPVGGLEEIVELDDALVGAVRVALVEAASVEVPDRGAAHDVHAKGAEDAKVDGRVHLLHEAGVLAAAEPQAAGEGPQHLLHDELAGEGKNDSIEGDEGDVPRSLAVVGGDRGVILRQAVGEEDEAVDRVGRRRVDGVAGQGEEDNDGGEHKGVLDHGLAHAREEASGAATFGHSLVGGRGGVAILRRLERRGDRRC